MCDVVEWNCSRSAFSVAESAKYSRRSSSVKHGLPYRPSISSSPRILRGCLKSLHGFLQRYPHAMVIVDFRELRTIVTSSEAALHQLKTLMSGLFKQPLRRLGVVL